MNEAQSNWRVATVGQALRIRYGKALKATDRVEDGRYPVVGSAGTMAKTKNALMTQSVIVIGRKGNIGQVQLFSDGAWPIDTTFYCSVPDMFDPRFLFYQLEALRLGRLDTSTATPSLRREDLESQLLVVPDIGVQRRIVESLEHHFSRLNAAKSLLSSASRRAGTLRSLWLSSLADRSVPTRTLGELSVSAGYGTSTKCAVDGLGVPVVRIPNLQFGRIDLKAEKRAIDLSVDLGALMLEQDDLLIVRTNGSRDLIGRAAVVQSGVRASFASYLIRFKLDRSIIRPEWARVMMGTPEARRILESMAASSAGQYNLGLKKLQAVPIPCPSLAQQDRLLLNYSEREWQIEQLAEQINIARHREPALRAALLTAAFTGQLSGYLSNRGITEEMAGV